MQDFLYILTTLLYNIYIIQRYHVIRKRIYVVRQSDDACQRSFTFLFLELLTETVFIFSVCRHASFLPLLSIFKRLDAPIIKSHRDHTVSFVAMNNAVTESDSKFIELQQGIVFLRDFWNLWCQRCIRHQMLFFTNSCNMPVVSKKT